MDAEFWLKRWQQQQIGFHQTEVNSFLQKYFPLLSVQPNDQVLVPLCGKSMDMVWLLQQGVRVQGVELSPLAIEQFMAEQQLSAAERIETAKFCHHKIEGLELLCGDFFDLSSDHCQEVKGVYDRAALVALPLKMRADYAAHLQRIVPKDTKILLVTMDYEQSRLQDPPFAVTKAEVHQLFNQAKSIQNLEAVSSMRKGVPIKEEVYLIEL